MDNKRTTIKDVARVAGVSTATVSHVINKTRYVSEEVRERVRAAVQSTNYSSNYIARALRGSKTHTVGVVIPEISNPFYSSIIYHMELTLHEAGYMMILCDSQESAEHEVEIIERLCGCQVEGIVLAPISPATDYEAWAQRIGCPIVYIDRYPNSAKYSGVFCTVREAVSLATEQMILCGHNCVALMNRDTAGLYSIVREREEGYRDALKKHGIEPDSRYIFEIPACTEYGYAKMGDILRELREVNGVFCANRHISLGALQCLIDSGRRIPEDMSIVGFAAYSWYNVTTPRLSCVLEPLKEMGEAAGRLILDVIADPDRPPEKIVLKASLVGSASIWRK
ncbi:MAG: LacI family DNA-binding transcriptional regulator [Clostridia bacterium]|nr:LacI family DNA-binding transcriptional regulator [Clostridia bacterium]